LITVESRNYFSRGKILLSGEYVVLFGARALALPARLGQHLRVDEESEPGTVFVRSLLNEGVWFSGIYALPDFIELQASDERVSAYVKSVLQAAGGLNPGFFDYKKGYKLLSTLEFDPRWGLGSSSSLISNIAWWTGIDPYQLLWKMSRGSGYDIACARASGPIIYQLRDGQPVIEDVTFDPGYKDKLFFVYLSRKQDSHLAVKEFIAKKAPDAGVIAEICGLTDQICKADSLEVFTTLVTRHEECLSAYLQTPTIKDSRFPGFGGAMKSLGAWGGDMVLVTWDREEEELRRYFDARGLKLIFRYEDLL
jgi:mevalonate kinase